LYPKSNSNESKNNNYNEENNYVKINKEYDNEIVVHSISPIKQKIRKEEKDNELKEIKVNKNQNEYILNDNKIIRGSSFKRISSFCVVKGTNRDNRVLIANNSKKKN